MSSPADKANPDLSERETNSAGDTLARFNLAERTRQDFASGLTVDEAIVDLTLGAMELRIEPAEAARLIREFYETCASRETPNDAIARCALMSPVQYDRVRKDVAKRHCVRPPTLDAEVAKLQKQHQAHAPVRRNLRDGRLLQRSGTRQLRARHCSLN